MQDMSFPVVIVPALILAISLSAPRFLRIFSPASLGGITVPTTSMFASAICLSALALAIDDQGPTRGAIIAMTGLLVSRAIRVSDGILPTVIAAISLAIYLQVRSASA